MAGKENLQYLVDIQQSREIAAHTRRFSETVDNFNQTGELSGTERLGYPIFLNRYAPQPANVEVNELFGQQTILSSEHVDTPQDQLAKLKFTEAVFAYTMTGLEKTRKDTAEDGSERTQMATPDRARASIAGSRNNILGWVRNGNADKLKEKYGIEIGGVEPSDLILYAQDLLLNPNAKDGSIFCINPKTIARINDEIEKGSEADKERLGKIKRVLGGLTQAMYLEIDKRIDPERLEEIEQAMRDRLNYIDGDPNKPRENTVVMINGHTGAGKGTTLKMLGTSAVETGTDGIAGRGEGFEQYELVMGPYDLARATGVLIPSRVMKLLFATEMLAARERLDQKGEFNTPVYVSGFPRDEVQAASFKDIKNMKSVALTIKPETAVVRTLTRIAMARYSGEAPRDDDFNDLTFGFFDRSNDILKDAVLALIDARLLIRKKENIDGFNIESMSASFQEVTGTILKMDPKSRYWKYDKMIRGDAEKNRKGIDQVLQECGVTTKYIECDGKGMEQVTSEVRQTLNLN